MSGHASLLVEAGSTTILAYEDAATAVGRLDAAAALAPSGLAELLMLRCAVTPFDAAQGSIVELLRPDSTGGPLHAYLDALREGARRARGGVVPSVATLRRSLGLSADGAPAPAALDAMLHDANGRTPPVLKAVLAAGELLRLPTEPGHGRETPASGPPLVASLAITLLLCVGGAITDAWLTMPLVNAPALAEGPSDGDEGWRSWLPRAFTAIAREARAAERGLATARDLVNVDAARIRDAFGRAAYSALDLHALLSAELVVNVPDAVRALGFTAPTAGAAVARLVELGVAREVTGRARSRAFIYNGLVVALAP